MDKKPILLEIKDKDFPPAFFEGSPFVIPGIIAEDVDAPIISVERHPKRSDIEKIISLLNVIDRELPEEFSFLSIGIADVKEYYVKQDLRLLVDLVSRYLDHELEKIGVDIGADLSSDIMQIVEVDFTMIDLCPGDTGIHYRLYTKRGIGRQRTDEQ